MDMSKLALAFGLGLGLNQKKFEFFKVTSLTPFRLLDPLLQQRKPKKQEIFERK